MSEELTGREGSGVYIFQAELSKMFNVKSFYLFISNLHKIEVFKLPGALNKRVLIPTPGGLVLSESVSHVPDFRMHRIYHHLHLLPLLQLLPWLVKTVSAVLHFIVRQLSIR